MSESYLADVVDQWHEMQDKFDCNPSMPNLYKEVEDRTFVRKLDLSHFYFSSNFYLSFFTISFYVSFTN